MSLSVFIALLGTILTIWFFVRGDNLSQALENEKKLNEQLRKKLKKLERTSYARGRRMDVLLSTVTEVVLRVDKLGRVLGGNTHASDLLQFGRFPKLPQSMLVFYRDTEWLSAYQKAIQALPEKTPLPEMRIKDRVFLPRLAAIEKNEALLICVDVTAYMQLQKKQKSLLENLMHDLKTPLTSLLGYARSIETFADDEALRQEAVSVIAKEAKHINNLMNSMLTLNQIEYKVAVSVEPCDVVETCQQVWDVLQAQLKNKSIKLDLQLGMEALSVNMAEADCHRVLINIAENAIKFSHAGASIECLVAQNKSNASVIINDRGCGIPDKHLDRVTERFYRVDDVRGQVKEEGHGLGLAIVKETLERDGGSLSLKNRDAGGLQVEILIPLA